MPRRHPPMTDQQRINRKMNNAKPEVRQRKAIRRAIKQHLTPPMVTGYKPPRFG